MATTTLEERLLSSQTGTQSKEITDSPEPMSVFAKLQRSANAVRALLVGAVLSGASAEAGEPSRITPLPDQQKTGSLVIAGGGPLPQVIRDEFVQRAGGKDAHVVIIPTASPTKSAEVNIPEKQSSFFWNGLQENVASASVFHAIDRDEADNDEKTSVLNDATGIWFGGGKQKDLVERYIDTLTHQKIYAVLKRGGVIGGTSAGASAMSGYPMIEDERNNEPIIGKGFDLLPRSIIDQHFIKRNRIPRLEKVVKTYPGNVGIGIDESTAAVVEGSKLTVIGESTVSIHRPPMNQTLNPGETFDLSSLGMAGMYGTGEH